MNRNKFKSKSKLEQWYDAHKQTWPAYLMLGLVAVLFLGGILNQATRVNLTGEKLPFTMNPFRCIANNFTEGFRGLAIILVIIIGICIWYYLRSRDLDKDLRDDERGFQTEKTGLHGVNNLMNEEEIREYADIAPIKLSQGIIVGKIASDDNPNDTSKVLSLPEDKTRYKLSATGRPILDRRRSHEIGREVYIREKCVGVDNQHAMICGPTGSGKTFCYALTNIFQSMRRGHSFFVTDPKGEIYSLTSEEAKKKGYTVKILNFASPSNSDSWDVLGEIAKNADMLDIELMTVCSSIIANTEAPGGKTDEAFRGGEENLLYALVSYIMHEMPEKKKKLGTVMDLLQEDDDALDTMFENAMDDMPKRPWKAYYNGSDAFRGNLRAGLNNRLRNLHDDVVRNMTSIQDIDLTLPGREKCAYYVVMEDMTSTFKFLSSLFFTELFQALVSYSRHEDSGKLPVRVNFILDEFTAIGTLPDFEKKLAMVRSAGISISMIFQTLTHLMNNYPDSWETLFANCATVIILKCNDKTTAEYMSSISGQTTIHAEQSRVARPVMDFGYVPSQVQMSESASERVLITPGEILTMHESQCLVKIAGADMFFAWKVPVTDLVDIDRIKETQLVNMYRYVPLWREKLNMEARNDFMQENKVSQYSQSEGARKSRNRHRQADIPQDDDLVDEPVMAQANRTGYAKKGDHQPSKTAQAMGEDFFNQMSEASNANASSHDDDDNSAEKLFDSMQFDSGSDLPDGGSYKDYDPSESGSFDSDDAQPTTRNKRNREPKSNIASGGDFAESF